MPIRFSTEAANADVMGDDSDGKASPAGMPRAARADSTRAHRFERPSRPGGLSGDTPSPQAKPGKDINAPGFIKDKDAPQP